MIFEKTKPAEVPATTRTVSEPTIAPPAYDAGDAPVAGPSSLRPTVSASPSASSSQRTEINPHILRSEDNVNARIIANPFLTPAGNLISIHDPTISIRGAWTIDTSLSPPPSFLAPQVDFPGREAVRPSLHLQTAYGSIHANVRTVRGQSSSPRAIVEASSMQGSVRVAVIDRGKQRVLIRARTTQGDLKILLPRDFNGVISYHTQNGDTLFSPAVKSLLTTFSVSAGHGKGFVGDWVNSGLASTSAAAPELDAVPSSEVRQERPRTSGSYTDPSNRLMPPTMTRQPSSSSFDDVSTNVSSISPYSSISQRIARAEFQGASGSTTAPSATVAAAANSAPWDGDEIEVGTVHGTIRIGFVDDPKDTQGTLIKSGALKAVKRFLQDRHLLGNSAAQYIQKQEPGNWIKGH